VQDSDQRIESAQFGIGIATEHFIPHTDALERVDKGFELDARLQPRGASHPCCQTTGMAVTAG
jgi:hypothetical protein